MATSSVSRLAMQLQGYFDQLAPTWDEQVTQERQECLSSIVKELDIEPGYCVLDVGSGTGILFPFLIAALDDQGRIVALDLSAEMLGQAKGKTFQSIADFVQADAMAIPLADHSVDLAICNSVFPHFDDKVRALKEMVRVLNDGGRLVICHTMSRAMINQLHQSIGGVVANDYLPDEYQLREQAEQAGLKITHFEDRTERYLVIAERHPH